jgi:peptide/nickel transport system substrate-binding protein
MKPTGLLFLALLSLAPAAHLRAAERPRYGGSVRIELGSSLASLDPAAPLADPRAVALRDHLLLLVADRLVRYGPDGRVEPALALSWTAGPGGRTCVFTLRPDVRFQDGAPLTAVAVADALRVLHPGWRFRAAAGESLEIGSDEPLPELLSELAAPVNSILRRASDGSLVGTGPFRLAEWQPGRLARFLADDDAWVGRPYLDGIEILMGRAPRERLLDLALGQADVVALLPEQVRQAIQQSMRVWSSKASELFALEFVHGRPAAEDARLREALALAVDRTALRDVLLEKQGASAASLLPDWLTGYGFVFPVAGDQARARQLTAEDNHPPPLRLAFDSSDPVAAAIAGRIAVDGRAAGLVVTPAGADPADARLVRLGIELPEPRPALLALARTLGIADRLRLPARASPEELLAAERTLLADDWVVPLVDLPELYALGPRVKDWMASGVPGVDGWRLEDVWLAEESK